MKNNAKYKQQEAKNLAGFSPIEAKWETRKICGEKKKKIFLFLSLLPYSP
jgi:hypothetical protein